MNTNVNLNGPCRILRTAKPWTELEFENGFILKCLSVHHDESLLAKLQELAHNHDYPVMVNPIWDYTWSTYTEFAFDSNIGPFTDSVYLSLNPNIERAIKHHINKQLSADSPDPTDTPPITHDGDPV